MARPQKEIEKTADCGMPAAIGSGQNNSGGAAMATVVHSTGRDLYYVASQLEAKRCWLSVVVFRGSEPGAAGPHPAVLAGVRCADGSGWRRAYSFDWSVVTPGLESTLPAEDPLVADYSVAADVTRSAAEPNVSSLNTSADSPARLAERAQCSDKELSSE